MSKVIRYSPCQDGRSPIHHGMTLFKHPSDSDITELWMHYTNISTLKCRVLFEIRLIFARKKTGIVLVIGSTTSYLINKDELNTLNPRMTSEMAESLLPLLKESIGPIFDAIKEIQREIPSLRNELYEPYTDTELLHLLTNSSVRQKAVFN